ncbi:MAG TPA: ATP-binding protein [Pyrinomonadaceae bacterium]
MTFKHSLTYLPHCLLPVFLIAGLNYWNALKTVDTSLSSQAQTDLNSLSGELDRRLQAEEVELTRVAFSGELSALLVADVGDSSNVTWLQQSNLTAAMSRQPFLALASLLRGRGHFERVAVFDQKRSPLFQIERQQAPQGADSFVIKPNGFSILSATVLTNKTATVTLKDSTLQYSIPVANLNRSEQVGILVAELNLNEVMSETAGVLTGAEQTGSGTRTFVAAIDPSAHFIYCSNRSLQGALVSSALPAFLPIAEAVSGNKPGVSRFQDSGGQDYVTAYAPLPRWTVGLAVGHDRSPFAAAAHRWGIFGLVLALLAGFTAALSLSYIIQKKSHGIERVEEGLSAIEKGELDRPIELKSSDDVRAIADSINAMAEKMRAQIAREEETRQFQSFVRLTAMLTHDLKNAIEALSLIVGNMERHFDNEQFRMDALKSLTGATDKLKGIVARLTKPLTSLSGEHPRPKSVDLVPLIRRVVAMTAEPLSEKHRIEVNLPQNLFVFTDPDRIEKVIENFIINALEAMADKNGKLIIDAGLTSRGAATFSITDTGPGMSPEFIDTKLFRPFSTTKKQGVGLGLYTCREVVEASAGSIEVESIEGAGTTFRVVLPSASHDSRY